MYDFGLWAAKELKPCSICFETLAESAVSKQSGLLACAPMDFVRNFIATKNALAPLGIKAILSTDAAEYCQFSFCPVGKDALIISPEGTVDACYWLPEEWTRKGLDLNMGMVTENGFELEIEKVERVRRAAALSKEACRNCLCQFQCAGGCHVRRSGNPERRYEQICFQTRLITIHRLLSEIGQVNLADAWIQNRAAIKDCVYSPSDRLDDLELAN
jgi:radical SAM protein with 4Fe4S-binding SPASM domain